MAKQKITVRSIQSINMADKNYMTLHKRMYVAYNSACVPHIYLHIDSSVKVSMPLTDSAAKDFLSYEMSFACLVNLFSSLCIKFGNLPF